jgi:hypothetical protein
MRKGPLRKTDPEGKFERALKIMAQGESMKFAAQAVGMSERWLFGMKKKKELEGAASIEVKRLRDALNYVHMLGVLNFEQKKKLYGIIDGSES